MMTGNREGPGVAGQDKSLRAQAWEAGMPPLGSGRGRRIPRGLSPRLVGEGPGAGDHEVSPSKPQTPGSGLGAAERLEGEG